MKQRLILQLMVLACTILLAAERPIGALAREALPLQEGQRLGGPAADKRPTTDTIAVDVAAGLRPVERRIVGINTNYLTDHAGVRSRGQG